MRQLVLLYWGCVFLIYLSQTYYPVETQLDGRQTGKRHFMLRRADVFMIVTILWLASFSFLRTSYNDTYNYIYAFQNSESISEGLQSGIFTDWTGNPLSELYESVMRSITTNYHVYFLIPAFLSSFAVIKLLKKYSVSPAFSLLIFFSIGTYIMYVAALKQCIAIFFTHGTSICNRQEVCEILSSSAYSSPIPYSCIHVCARLITRGKALGKNHLGPTWSRSICYGNI